MRIEHTFICSTQGNPLCLENTLVWVGSQLNSYLDGVQFNVYWIETFLELMSHIRRRINVFLYCTVLMCLYISYVDTLLFNIPSAGELLLLGIYMQLNSRPYARLYKSKKNMWFYNGVKLDHCCDIHDLKFNPRRPAEFLSLDQYRSCSINTFTCVLCVCGICGRTLGSSSLQISVFSIIIQHSFPCFGTRHVWDTLLLWFGSHRYLRAHCLRAAHGLWSYLLYTCWVYQRTFVNESSVDDRLYQARRFRMWQAIVDGESTRAWIFEGLSPISEEFQKYHQMLAWLLGALLWGFLPDNVQTNLWQPLNKYLVSIYLWPVWRHTIGIRRHCINIRPSVTSTNVRFKPSNRDVRHWVR